MGWELGVMGWDLGVMGWELGMMGWELGVMGWELGVMGWEWERWGWGRWGSNGGCETPVLCPHPRPPPTPRPTHNEHEDGQQLGQALSCQLVLDAEQHSSPLQEGRIVHGAGPAQTAMVAPAALTARFYEPRVGVGDNTQTLN